MDNMKPDTPRHCLRRVIPCAIIIDCTSKAIVQQQDAINQWLRNFRAEAQRYYENNGCLLDTCIITVGKTVDTVVPFFPVEHIPDLYLFNETGASLDAAVTKALDLLDERKAFYRCTGLNYSKSRLYVLSADIVHYFTSSTNSLNQLRSMIENGKLYFYPIICLPPLSQNRYYRIFHDGFLPTLQSPSEAFSWVGEDHWSVSLSDLDNDNSHTISTPPIPPELTIGI